MRINFENNEVYSFNICDSCYKIKLTIKFLILLLHFSFISFFAA